jgi:hypothetical protein
VRSNLTMPSTNAPPDFADATANHTLCPSTQTASDHTSSGSAVRDHAQPSLSRTTSAVVGLVRMRTAIQHRRVQWGRFVRGAVACRTGGTCAQHTPKAKTGITPRTSGTRAFIGQASCVVVRNVACFASLLPRFEPSTYEVLGRFLSALCPKTNLISFSWNRPGLVLKALGL